MRHPIYIPLSLFFALKMINNTCTFQKVGVCFHFRQDAGANRLGRIHFLTQLMSCLLLSVSRPIQGLKEEVMIHILLVDCRYIRILLTAGAIITMSTFTTLEDTCFEGESNRQSLKQVKGYRE